jgi:hypothetical protein
VEKLVELLDSCRDLGVTWSAKEVLVARMTEGDPGITDNAKAHAHVRTIAGWQPLPRRWHG